MQIHSNFGTSASQIPASTPSANPVPLPSVPYSTRVAGKTYSANVEPVASEFEAQVPNLPEARVIGPTVEKVEDSLSNLISFFA